MYHSESRIVRTLTFAGTVFGLIASLVTIYAYLSTDGSPLGWIGTESLGHVAVWARSFEESWPFGPVLTALLVYGIIGAIAIVSDRWSDTAEYVGMLLLLFPLPGIWIWIFSDVVSSWALISFLLGYAVVPWLPIVAVSFWLEDRDRRVVEGTVREVTIRTEHRFRKKDVCTIVLARDG